MRGKAQTVFAHRDSHVIPAYAQRPDNHAVAL